MLVGKATLICRRCSMTRTAFITVRGRLTSRGKGVRRAQLSIRNTTARRTVSRVTTNARGYFHTRIPVTVPGSVSNARRWLNVNWSRATISFGGNARLKARSRVVKIARR